MNVVEAESWTTTDPRLESEREVEEDDFEFASDPGLGVTADKASGRILPIYPVFGRDILNGNAAAIVATAGEEKAAVCLPFRRLAIEDCTRSGSVSSSSSVDDLDVTQSTSSSAWTPRSVPPSPDRWGKKSSSTGSASRRWKIRDLMVGRSQSDGKEKFVIVPPMEKRNKAETAKDKGIAAKERSKGKDSGKGSKVTEMDMATAHRLYYVKGSEASGGGGRRSFLPYKQDLVGLLGLSRTNTFRNSS